jgi:hypothetical protein
MSVRFFSRLFVFVYISFGLCIFSWGQTSSGIISGRVVDQSGGAVPDVTVRLINQETSVSVTTHTLSHGEFTFADVQPGTFRWKCRRRATRCFRKRTSG